LYLKNSKFITENWKVEIILSISREKV